MFRELVVETVKWLISGVLMAAVAGWVSRSRSGARTVPGVMRNPTSILVIGVVTVVFFGALLIVSNTIARNETTTWWTSAIFGALTLLGLWAVLGWFIERVDLDDDGLRQRTSLGVWHDVRWGDVHRVEWKPGWQQFHVAGPARRLLKIGATMTGLPEFAGRVLAYVPEDAIDSDTLVILSDTQAGRLPALR